MNPTVVILHQSVAEDSGPDELDVVDQAGEVETELRRMGYKVTRIDFDLDLKKLLQRIQGHHPFCVFNLVETVMGDPRLAPFACTLLEAAGLAYTGSGPDAMHLTTNKVLAKKWMRAQGIPTPAWFMPGCTAETDIAFPAMCIVKPVWEDASVGIDGTSVVEARSAYDLDRLVQERTRRFRKPCFAEQFIDGREFNVAVLASGQARPEVLPVSEIVFDLGADNPRIVDYNAKWIEDSAEYRGTQRVLDFADSDRELIERLKETALGCWDAFGLTGYARVDFRVGKDGVPMVLEINANPCIAPGSGFRASAEKAGISFGEIVGRILQDALCRGGRKEPVP